MPRRYKIILLALLLLAGLYYYTGIMTRTFEKEVAVPYTMQKTGEQLYQMKNVVKWYFPFSTYNNLAEKIVGNTLPTATDGHEISILTPTSVSSIIEGAYKGNKRQFLFTAVTDTNELDACKIKLHYKCSLLDNWLDKGGLIKEAKKSLENLKAYMEDTKQFYGYTIEETTVADTAFIFRSATVPIAKKRAATKELFEQLIEYSNANNGGYTGARIFYSIPYGKDMTMLFASIGVSNMIVTKPGEPVQYKRMPFGKNLLMATYQGPYKDIDKVYLALENFKTDHKLSSMAIPYQKFLSDGYDFADDQIVQMKVYYPIF